ncbi:amidohydrolase [Hoeflea poritis]|uniref:Amidohydrolase n=1 Tax=Hoeflea poritis TaxID=2993659 RepID=A0ABT4VJR3_9HYPH|nr:amidohydrolase [Hoeflea poritis]MDA4844268.1 amidohydrolase [Hoeflea poritis]
MRLTQEQIETLISIRHDLHRQPELSGEEERTAQRIGGHLKQMQPDAIIRGLGGTGVAAVFDSGQPGPSVMIRCELDGLPIRETGTAAHRSEIDGKGHQCGHDGHMTMVLGVAMLLRERPPRGRVVLLFQPAEETGQGARAVISDPRFENIRCDFSIALHNLPGYEAHRIILKEGHVNCASRGMRIRLEGTTAHAAQPEAGVSPAQALADIIRNLDALTNAAGSGEDFSLVTIVHANLGEKAFGVSPAEAELWATLRTETDDKMLDVISRAEATAARAAEAAGVTLEISYDDIFNACENDAHVVSHMRENAGSLGLDVEDLRQPLRFSEDFGEFGKQSASAMFFLGAGHDMPALHNPDYDFPDALISTGVSMLNATMGGLIGRNTPSGVD